MEILKGRKGLKGFPSEAMHKAKLNFCGSGKDRKGFNYVGQFHVFICPILSEKQNFIYSENVHCWMKFIIIKDLMIEESGSWHELQI